MLNEKINPFKSKLFQFNNFLVYNMKLLDLYNIFDTIVFLFLYKQEFDS